MPEKIYIILTVADKSKGMVIRNYLRRRRNTELLRETDSITGLIDILEKNSYINGVLIVVIDSLSIEVTPIQIKDITQTMPAARLLLITSNPQAAFLDEAIQNGCRGFIDYYYQREWNKAIAEVAEFGDYLPKNFATALSDYKQVLSLKALQKFKPRICEFLAFFHEGYSTKEISDKMLVSVDAVKGYKKELYSEFNCHSETELQNLLYAHGFYKLKPRQR